MRDADGARKANLVNVGCCSYNEEEFIRDYHGLAPMGNLAFFELRARAAWRITVSAE